MTRSCLSSCILLGVLVLTLGACARPDPTATDPDLDTGASATDANDDANVAIDPVGDGDPIAVAVTTVILGDIVEQVLDGTGAEVAVLIPPGVDPHAYEPSASAGLALREVDLVVANGLQFEEALLDVLASVAAEGVPVIEVAEQLDGLLEPTGVDHEDGDEAEHEDESGDEDDHGAFDPHVWLDPINVGEMAQIIADAYAEVDAGAEATVDQNADDVVAEMAALDEELQAMVATLDEGRRQLVTNHESLGYLAARYDLDVLATVIPGTSTDVEVTAAGFTDLVELIREADVPAIFADTSSSDRLAQSLADEVEDVEVVELFTESFGEPGSDADTVGGMIRTNIERIVTALG